MPGPAGSRFRIIARRHPDLDEREVLLRWAELHDGEALTARVRAYLAAQG